MRYIAIFLLAIAACACGSGTDFLPKPKGYNRIDLPEHAFQSLPDTMPYAFEYSKYAKVLKDSSWISEPYWIDIHYPEMEAFIQITYKPIKNDAGLTQEYISDSYKLTAQHNVKAYAIEEMIMELPNGDYASVTELEGEVPSQFQFHVSDSSKHFLRGALYFETATKNDSLAPVIGFLKEDILYMLQTLRWNN